MPLINWEKSFSVGVKEIDEQHQKMIAILNELYKMVSDNNYGAEETGKILQELADYEDYHFSTEEKYFKQFEYDKTVEHMQLHDDYRKRVAEFKKQYDSEPSNSILSDLSVFLNGWWTWHINNTDKEYVACFHQHGLY